MSEIDVRHDSAEYIFPTLLNDGTPVLAGVQFAVAKVKSDESQVPGNFTPAAIVNGTSALLLQPVSADQVGQWVVYAQATNVTPEIPVKECGRFYRS